MVKKDTASFDSIVIAKDQTVEMPKFSRDDVSVANSGTLVVALQENTAQDTAKDYVWLTKQGLYEQVTVSPTGESAGTTWVNTSDKSNETKNAAIQIANNIEDSVTVGTETYSISVDSTTREIVVKDSSETVVTDASIVNAAKEEAVESSGLTADPLNVTTVDQFLSLVGNVGLNHPYKAPKVNFMKLGADLDLTEAKLNGTYINYQNYAVLPSTDLNNHKLTVRNFSLTIRTDGATISNGSIEAMTGTGNTLTELQYAGYVLAVGADYVTLENVKTIGGVSWGEDPDDGNSVFAASGNYGLVKNCELGSTRYYSIIAQNASSVSVEGGRLFRHCSSTITSAVIAYTSTANDWGYGTCVIKFTDVKTDRANPFNTAITSGATVTQLDSNTWLINGQSAATVTH